MLKILILVCFLAAVLSSIVLVSWLKSRRGRGERAARLYLVLKNRDSGFRLFQIPLLLITAVILTIAVGRGTGWYDAAAYIAGAVVSFGAVLLASSLNVSGISSSVHSAELNDIPLSVKCSYRAGAAQGFILSAAGLVLLCALFLAIGDEFLVTYAAPLALGVSTTALFLNTGGSVYSAAYSMAMPDKDFRDSTGNFYAEGSDILESFVVSGAASVMLADLAVATSGITSTFTGEAAAKYPVVVLGCGVAACIIGSLIFRAGNVRRPSGNYLITVLIAGIISAAASLYFSNMMLQTMVYGYTVIIGIAAGLIMTAISVLYSSGSKLMVGNSKNDRKLGKHARVIFNLGAGMTSALIFAVIMTAALIVSFNFASYYGIALCSVGFCSVAVLISAVSGMNIFTGTTSEIVDSEYFTAESDEDPAIFNEISDRLSTASSNTGSAAGTMLTAAGFLSSAAMLSAVYYISEAGSVTIISEKSVSMLLAMIGGAASVFFLLGTVISSVRITSTVALRKIDRTEEESASNTLRGSLIPSILAIAFPAVVGLFFGFRLLFAFLSSAVITGFLLVNIFNNSGRYFENTASRSLNSLIKLMVVFSAVFTSVILNIGGFIH